jgi:BlaI family transcriptional regulator, penicillinase repressor
MPRKARDVTDAELAILQVLWAEQTATVRSLAERLYPAAPDKQVPTVQKLLGRLEAKDCVTRDRDAWPHRYRAAIDREELVGRRLESTAEELCGGSFAPLLLYLISRPLSDRDRAALRAMLDEQDQGDPSHDAPPG